MADQRQWTHRAWDNVRIVLPKPRLVREKTAVTVSTDPKALKQIHRATTMALAEFDRVCRLLGLRYCVYGGTAIGALRHGGFIPWDDDVDVCMPRQDYELLIAQAPAVMGDDYVFLCQEVDPDFPKTFGLFGLSGTRFQPADAGDRPYSIPIGVDVFPLDYVSRARRKYQAQARRTWLWGRMMFLHGSATPSTGLSPVVDAVAQQVFRATHAALTRVSAAQLYDRWKQAATESNYEDGVSRLADFSTQEPLRWAADEDELFPSVRMPFGDIHVEVARDADAVLTRGYGDYMTLPPEDERVNHSASLVDFGDFTF